MLPFLKGKLALAVSVMAEEQKVGCQGAFSIYLLVRILLHD